MNPIRIQRKRTKGWKMPANTVYVGRPGKFGNPWTITKNRSAFICAILFTIYTIKNLEFREQIKRELKGKNLACWCPLDQPCHADVLLEIANN